MLLLVRTRSYFFWVSNMILFVCQKPYSHVVRFPPDHHHHQRAYYCSDECRISQWHAGHKDHCRHRRVIRAGEYRVIWDLEKKPELNGEIVLVKGPDPKQPRRWAVQQPGFDNTMSIAAKKLIHLRPLK